MEEGGTWRNLRYGRVESGEAEGNLGEAEGNLGEAEGMREWANWLIC
jgi:hypothetical protein